MTVFQGTAKLSITAGLTAGTVTRFSGTAILSIQPFLRAAYSGAIRWYAAEAITATVGLRANTGLKARIYAKANLVSSLSVDTSVLFAAQIIPEPAVVGTAIGLGRRAIDEAVGILERMTEAYLSGLSGSGELGANVRRITGALLANAETLIKNGTIGTQLYACFEQARLAGETLDQMDAVREAMLLEAPFYVIGMAVKLAGIVMSFAEQCQMISAMTFTSQNDVQVMLTRTVAIVEEIKLQAMDLLEGNDYQNVVSLAAALMQHLSATELQLPRIVNFTLGANFPSLVVAQLIYADASRSNEIESENGVINPCFVAREIIALSE